MSFLDNEKKTKDLLELSKNDFLKKYNHLSEEEYQHILDMMWEELEDIPTDEMGIFIENPFYIWNIGTQKEDIWHWFDKRVEGGIGNRYFN